MALQRTTIRIGLGAALFNILGGIAYLVILVSMITSGTSMSDPAAPPLVAASVMMLIGPLGLIPLWTAIHLTINEDNKVFSLVSLIFVILFSAATSINRWVHLTVVRESLTLNITQGLEWFTPYGEHSIMFAIELLAYSWFLGFSLLSLVPIYRSRTTRLEASLFWLLLICGTLCLLGGISELAVIDSIPIFIISMAGWSLGLFLVNILLAVWFNHLRKNEQI